MWRSYFLSSFVEFHSAVSEEKYKISQPSRGWDGHLVFPIGPKNTSLVEDVEILISVKFRWIPFSRFREVEYVSGYQRPGQPSCFSNRSKKTKTYWPNFEILLPFKFHWILFGRFRGEVENVKAYAGRRGITNGRRAMTIAHLSLQLCKLKTEDNYKLSSLGF